MTKRAPKDINQIAALIVEKATQEPTEQKPEKNPAAVALGRLGGLKGGKARAEALGKKGLSEASKKAINARWDKVLTPERRRELARIRKAKMRMKMRGQVRLAKERGGG